MVADGGVEICAAEPPILFAFTALKYNRAAGIYRKYNKGRHLTHTRFAEEEQLAWMKQDEWDGRSWMMATCPASETIPDP